MSLLTAPRLPGKQAVSLYAQEAVSQVPRLLSLLDREPHSPSYGSFDREHWGWKFRDFPLTMLQAAMYPVALLWRFPLPGNRLHRSPCVLAWVAASVENTCRRQHRNGAFDSVGPYTQDHGVSLAIAYALTETVRLLGGELQPALLERVREVVRRCCQFALRSEEDYAFINNHQALFALAFLNCHALLGEATYRERAEQIVKRILREQSDDGWYREYGGPDPGYESLGIFYLATYWKRTGSPELLESLRRSVEFYAHCVHPDGSVGGVYGSRHTSLYFPGGFEMLAAKVPMAASVARFMRERLRGRNVVTPSSSDVENLPPLMYGYLEACLAGDTPRQEDGPPLPCEALDGVRHFPDSGTCAVGTSHYYAVINASKGGVCRVFDRRKGNVVYEDAGYLVRAGRRRWSSQFTGLGRRVSPSRPGEVHCEARLAEVRPMLPTPLKFILLRVLNLTLFRSLKLGAWVRRLVLGQLITGRRPGPLRLSRAVTFEADRITFRDQLEAARRLRVEEVALPRAFTAVHMGSAKYFHPSQLEETPQAPVGGMALGLTRERVARCEFTLVFNSASAPQLVTAAPAV